MANSETSSLLIDQRNGFCNANSTFYSKRKPLAFPSNDTLDITTFISSQVHRGTIAFIDAATDHRISYSELWRAVDSVADCLYHDVGVRKGDVVLIFSPNSIFISIVAFSVMSLGAIISTANPLYTAREIGSQIADSNPKVAFTTPELAIKLTSSEVSIILERADYNLRVPHGMKVVGILSEMMKKEPKKQRFRERVHKDDIAMLLYSSGTTGISKGVDSSHGNLVAHVARFIAEPFEQPQQTVVCTVALFHSFGLHNYTLATVTLGTKVVILPNFDLRVMMATVEKYRATTLVLVPPVIVAMINKVDMIKANYNVSSLKTLRCAGAPLSKEVTEAFVKEYPNVDIYQAYALTESNAAGASVESVEESRRYGSVGLLSCGVEARIVDPSTGRVMGVNQTGELWLKGPAICKGYYKNEEATKESKTPEGWLKTGDICYIDEDGFLFIVDRLKELIKYKGYQVAPAELEALLLNHPQILDAAVIPFPCKETGQYPMAYVVRKQESDLSETQVINFISKQVAPYKKIRNVAFINSIPKTPSGKILRKDLMKLAISKI